MKKWIEKVLWSKNEQEKGKFYVQKNGQGKILIKNEIFYVQLPLWNYSLLLEKKNNNKNCYLTQFHVGLMFRSILGLASFYIHVFCFACVRSLHRFTFRWFGTGISLKELSLFRICKQQTGLFFGIFFFYFSILRKLFFFLYNFWFVIKRYLKISFVYIVPIFW